MILVGPNIEDFHCLLGEKVVAVCNEKPPNTTSNTTNTTF